MAFYTHVPHFSVLATWEYVKRTVSARADGAVCIGREVVPVSDFVIFDLINYNEEFTNECVQVTGSSETWKLVFEFIHPRKSPLNVDPLGPQKVSMCRCILERLGALLFFYIPICFLKFGFPVWLLLLQYSAQLTNSLLRGQKEIKKKNWRGARKADQNKKKQERQLGSMSAWRQVVPRGGVWFDAGFMLLIRK